MLVGQVDYLYDLLRQKPVEGLLRYLLDVELLVVLLSNFCFRHGGRSRNDLSRNRRRIQCPQAAIP